MAAMERYDSRVYVKANCMLEACIITFLSAAEYNFILLSEHTPKSCFQTTLARAQSAKYFLFPLKNCQSVSGRTTSWFDPKNSFYAVVFAFVIASKHGPHWRFHPFISWYFWKIAPEVQKLKIFSKFFLRKGIGLLVRFTNFPRCLLCLSKIPNGRKVVFCVFNVKFGEIRTMSILETVRKKSTEKIIICFRKFHH